MILRIKYFILLLPLLLLSACETDVKDVLLPEFSQKLVVTGFMSPMDNEMKFTVSLNKRIYGELNLEEPIIPTTAFLSDGSKEVELDPVAYGFRIGSERIAFDYGKTYSLRISDGKELSIESASTIPFKRDFYLKADTFMYKNSFQMDPGHYYNENVINVKVSLTDFPGEKNYYRLVGEVTNYYTFRNTGDIIRNNYSLTFEKQYFTDNLTDGKVISIKSEDNLYHLSSGRDSAFLRLFLLNTEESYYLYHKSIMDHNDGENPFAEATPVFSNIKGGLGVFASYTIDSLILRLK